MDIQWPLVVFTFLAGTGAWLFVFVALNEFTGKLHDDPLRFRATVTAIVLVVLGGCASVLHLSHPDRMMGALAHPTSGIFMEALFVGLVTLTGIIFVVASRRGVGAGALKGIGAVAMVCALGLSYVSGAGYMMDAQALWNTPLMPLSYMATAGAAGSALYLLFTATSKAGDRHVAQVFVARCVMVLGIVSIIMALVYAAVSGAIASADGLPMLMVTLIGAAVAAVFGFLAMRRDAAVTVAVIALVGGLTACVAFRCFMWLVGTGTFDFFSGALFFATI